MGNYFTFFQKKLELEEQPLLEDKNLEERTLQRIEESKKSDNGVLCHRCGVALKPIFIKRMNIPFYCRICSNVYYGIQGTYGVLSLVHEEDYWMAK